MENESKGFEKLESKGYEKPQIIDFGSLEELTAACATSGAGDFHGAGFSPTFTDSQGHVCTS